VVRACTAARHNGGMESSPRLASMLAATRGVDHGDPALAAPASRMSAEDEADEAAVMILRR
jgi:hypothetical protein